MACNFLSLTIYFKLLATFWWPRGLQQPQWAQLPEQPNFPKNYWVRWLHQPCYGILVSRCGIYHQKPSILLSFCTFSLGGCRVQMSRPNECTDNFTLNLTCIFLSLRAKLKNTFCPRTLCPKKTFWLWKLKAWMISFLYNHSVKLFFLNFRTIAAHITT